MKNYTDRGGCYPPTGGRQYVMSMAFADLVWEVVCIPLFVYLITATRLVYVLAAQNKVFGFLKNSRFC